MLEILVPVTLPSFVALYLLVSEIAEVLPEVVYCCLQELQCILCCLHVGQSYCFLSLHYNF